MMRGMLLAVAVCGAATGVWGDGLLRPSAAVPVHQLEILGADAGARSLPQLIFDSASKRLERRIFELRAPRLGGALDVVWEPRVVTQSGPLNGPGRVIWRVAGSAPYEPAAVVAVFDGQFHDGRAVGQGTLWHRDGTIYEGGWDAGQMAGQGRISLPGGASYEGAFAAGLRHGMGQLIQPNGDIFDGTFEAGQLNGTVRVTPFNAAPYTAFWQAGREVPGSRVTGNGPPPAALHQVQATSLPDARLGIGLDPTPPVDWLTGFDPYYRSENRGSVMAVFPADPAILAAWTRDGPIPVNIGETARLSQSYHVSPGFSMSFENIGARPLQIAGGYLAVDRSVSNLRPALEVYMWPDCGELFRTEFFLQNFGWREPTNTRISIDLTDRAGRKAVSLSGPVTMTRPETLITLDQGLEAYGMRMNTIRQRGFLTCQSGTAAGCEAELRASGLYGDLAPAIWVEGSSINIMAKARFDYDWQDAQGRVQAGFGTFSLPLKLGKLNNLDVECGEGGGGEERFPNPFRLDLDRSAYTFPFNVQAQVFAGEQRNWSFQIEADRASFHRFQVVLVLADGREIASRPIEVEYTRARDLFATQ